MEKIKRVKMDDFFVCFYCGSDLEWYEYPVCKNCGYDNFKGEFV